MKSAPTVKKTNAGFACRAGFIPAWTNGSLHRNKTYQEKDYFTPTLKSIVLSENIQLTQATTTELDFGGEGDEGQGGFSKHFQGDMQDDETPDCW